MSLTSTPAGSVREEDRTFFERELAGFVPDRVFDAHCHLWPKGYLSPDAAMPPDATPTIDVGSATYRRLMDGMLPGRSLGALFLAAPGKERATEAGNEWVAAQARGDPRARCALFVRPEDDPEWVRTEVRRLGARGLKCYHSLSRRTTTWDADLPEYLPEPIVRVADEEGLAITLHMVKPRSVADPSNISWIRSYCTRFPRMTMILAHSARAFQPAHALEGLPRLADLPNLVIDTSANCEAMAHVAALRLLGPQRVLYGSDFWVSHLRGRSLAAEDTFLWLYEDSPVWREKHASIAPVLIGLEHLRSLKWACWTERLTDHEIEDVFWNNAAALFGVPSA